MHVEVPYLADANRLREGTDQQAEREAEGRGLTSLVISVMVETKFPRTASMRPATSLLSGTPTRAGNGFSSIPISLFSSFSSTRLRRRALILRIVKNASSNTFPRLPFSSG